MLNFFSTFKKIINLDFDAFSNFSREIVICQNNTNKSDNFSREIEVCQNNANISDNFSREIEVCQNNENKSLKECLKIITSHPVIKEKTSPARILCLMHNLLADRSGPVPMSCGCEESLSD